MDKRMNEQKTEWRMNERAHFALKKLPKFINMNNIYICKQTTVAF